MATMRKILLSICLITSVIGFSQKNEETLLTVNDTPITVGEFKQVYLKNLDLVQDQEQRSIDGYLDLFVNYKLKVAAAIDQGLDKKPTYLKDFAGYEEQLSRNYIYEDNVTSELVREAFERSREQIDASHILIMCNWDAFPQDTLEAYNRASQLREMALKNPDNFNALARQYSEEPGADEREGRLGYFTAFGMIYSFETEAYNTPVGEISDVVRTQFGYHVIKVHDRRAVLPKITVSHIMISTRNDTSGVAQERILEVEQLLSQGAPFEDLAKQYSDDKNTGQNGGLMRPFSKGDLKAPPFEDASFELKTPGEISAPIQTRFGWHLIRLESFGQMPTFEEEKKQLEANVRSGDRSKIVTSAVTSKMKEKLGFKGYPFMSEFLAVVNDSIFQRKWHFEPFAPEDNKPLFTVGSETYYFNEFGTYIEGRQGKVRPYKQIATMLQMVYEEFESLKVQKYFKANLEKVNPEYAAIINEYRDGLLIFDVMEKNIWTKAKNDTLGQANYYQAHQDQYQWKRRVKGTIFRTVSQQNMDQVLDLLRQGVSPDQVKGQLSDAENMGLLVTEGVFEQGDKALPPTYPLVPGLSSVYQLGPKQYVVVHASEIIEPGVKTFDEVAGQVFSDYQSQLETIWMEDLKSNYTVSVNKRALRKLKRALKK